MNVIQIGCRCVVIVLLVGAAAGCMRSRVEQAREMPTKVARGEAIVILAKPQVEGAATEQDFMNCVGNNLGSGSAPLAVRKNEEFMDALFPWFEPGTAPTKPEAVASVLSHPGVSEKIAATGVRYVVWVNGITRKTDGGGSLACGAAPGAAGCIGFGWWEKESNYEATIWDLKEAKSAGIVDADVTGTSAIVGAIVPRVQGTACNRLSSQLRSFFTGEDLDSTPARQVTRSKRLAKTTDSRQ